MPKKKGLEREHALGAQEQGQRSHLKEEEEEDEEAKGEDEDQGGKPPRAPLPPPPLHRSLLRLRSRWLI